jgi:hypothetical protein
MLQPPRAEVLLWWLPWQAALCIVFILAGTGRARRLGVEPGQEITAEPQIAFHVKR